MSNNTQLAVKYLFWICGLIVLSQIRDEMHKAHLTIMIQTPSAEQQQPSAPETPPTTA